MSCVIQKKPLSELRKEVRLFPQGTLNLQVAEKKPLGTLNVLNQAIADIEKAFGEEGRVLVRYSGTEPKLRLLVEGKDEKRVSDALKDLEKAACSEFGCNSALIAPGRMCMYKI